MIRLDKADIAVQEFEPDLCECQEAPVTHYVQIDLRSAGMTQALGEYCEKCAEEMAERIRASLPEAEG